MQPQMALLWEVSVFEFVLVTMVLGGALAYMIGRSTALTWSGWGLMTFYTLLLTIAARFIHFSLFDGTFFLPLETLGTAAYYAGIDFIVLMAFAAAGRMWTRKLQTQRQYGFLDRAA
ncbi:DUF6867 family protein [Aureimonas populi]|uniref:DUF6867 family protein n=1 Tax=Aureimonas populi TaxID=1701758 RepID=A0ABW5CK15_9HYPH|nr:hypothetical protein [Aureimonas populi]